MNMIEIRVVNADFKPVAGATVSASDDRQSPIRLVEEEGRWTGAIPRAARITVNVSAKGYESETHVVTARDGVTSTVIGLRKPGQMSYAIGTDRLSFAPQNEQVMLRVAGPAAAEALAKLMKARRVRIAPVGAAPDAAAESLSGDEALVRVETDAERGAELAAELVEKGRSVQMAMVIGHGERQPVGLTNELVVRFKDDVRRGEAERLAASVGLRITREVRHAGNGFLLVREGPPSYDILKAADALMMNGRVVYAEPNLLVAYEADAYLPNDPLFAQVPHLGLIEADEAWELLGNAQANLLGGSTDITIAVVDLNGITPNHPEFTATLTDGNAKLVTSVNFASSPISNQAANALGGNHGTQCASSATAAFDNGRGIAGVAPNCHLIGARIGGSGSAVAMADLYLWAAGFDNGSMAAGFPALPARPADVISSSFGATGLALSNTIRDCFDFLTSYGRQGRGCVVCFSLGNSGYGDFTDPLGTRFRAWPTYEKNLGVGSSINVNPTNPVPFSSHPNENGNSNNIPTAVDRRSLFSPFGATALRKPDLVSPSHTAYGPALIDPVLAAVAVGAGNVNGCPAPNVCNDYAFSFGGTSHSTPTVAGAVALILSARPSLNWVQVRELLRQTCVRIDAGQANAIGQWQDLDGDGLIDYSRWYGAGRLDVRAAVERALDPSLPLADVYVRENLSDTGAVPSTGSWWHSPDIWVREDSNEAIPALAWSSAPPHQNARRGQANSLFCRVRNRGAVAAPTVYVRAMLTHWAGFEFLYPADFQPSTNVGSPLPSPLVPGTYLIGEARVDDLASGADEIVKFTWPQALVPPASVMVGSATVHWHPCLLVDASPHDGPDPIGGLAVPVQGNNNIAQRNITIVDASDASADSDAFIGMIAGTRREFGVATLLVDASRLRNHAAIRLHIADEKVMRSFVANAMQVYHETPGGGGGSGHAGEKGGGAGVREACGVVLEHRTRLRVPCGPCVTIIEAAAGSRILTGCCGARGAVRARIVRHHGLESVELLNLSGQVEIPMRLAGNRFVPVLAAVESSDDSSVSGELSLTQRVGDGTLSAGYGITFV